MLTVLVFLFICPDDFTKASRLDTLGDDCMIYLRQKFYNAYDTNLSISCIYDLKKVDPQLISSTSIVSKYFDEIGKLNAMKIDSSFIGGIVSGTQKSYAWFHYEIPEMRYRNDYAYYLKATCLFEILIIDKAYDPKDSVKKSRMHKQVFSSAMVD